MDYFQLKGTDLQLSRIALGTMSLPLVDSVSEAMVQKAISGGINFFDTADLYEKGEIERMLGRILKTQRQQIHLATKVGNVWNPDGKGWHWDPSPQRIKIGLEESLRRLQTDYIDLYQLHGGTIDDPWDDILDTFESLKKEGKIRAYGVSSIRPNVVKKLTEYPGLSSLMCQYSMLDRRAEESIFPLCEQVGIQILVRGAYAKGLLLGKAAKEYLNYTSSEITSIVNRISQTPFDPEALAMRFALSPTCNESLVIGASTFNQIAKTLSGYDLSQNISREELGSLRKSLPINFYDSHR
ncbi:aldo/keto reductase [Algoriphagus namhaensis]